MTLFWILAAALLLAALAVLLLAMRRGNALSAPSAGASDSRASNVRILRDQLAELDSELEAGTLAPDQHAAARTELERRVLEETRTAEVPVTARAAQTSAWALALAVPVLAIGLYAMLGNRMAFDPILAKPPALATAADVETLVERLAQRMQAQPDDPAGWALLGRAYAGMQRFDAARDAYARAAALLPDDPQLLADYADALAMTQGQRLAGEPEQLVLRALQSDPDNLKALALAGSAAMERGDFRAAVAHWTRARRVAPPGSPFASGLDDSLREARAAAGLAPEPVATAPAGTGVGSMRVKVSLSPALAAQVLPGDTLFVFARAAEGPRMPLAIARRSASELPLELTLDDSMAMSPQLRLSAFERVVVGARVSRSGNATPQPGDLEGQSVAVAADGETVAVVIEGLRP